jgi:hypothetical protein
VDWVRAGAADLKVLPPLSRGDVVPDLSEDMIAEDSSLIMSETAYVYVPTFGEIPVYGWVVEQQGIKMTRVSYSLPRLSTTVACSRC